MNLSQRLSKVLCQITRPGDRSQAIVLIEDPTCVVFFRLPATNSSHVVTTECIELTSALGFSDQTGWQQLRDILEPHLRGGGCIILHPSLYLVQAVSGNCLPRMSDSLFYQQGLVNNTILAYYRDISLTEYFPQCKYIIPCLELVRSYALVNQLRPPWIIASDKYLWIADMRQRVHEGCITQQSHLEWLFQSLFDSSAINTDCTCLVNQRSMATMLSNKGFAQVSINKDLATMSSMFAIVSGFTFHQANEGIVDRK